MAVVTYSNGEDELGLGELDNTQTNERQDLADGKEMHALVGNVADVERVRHVLGRYE